MTTFNYILSIALISLILLFLGCERKDTAAEYKSEAIALCEVFSPQKWENMPKDITPTEIQQILVDGIQSAVHSDKMIEVIVTIAKIPAELRYKYVVESVTALTGEPYSCPGLEEYFNV